MWSSYFFLSYYDFFVSLFFLNINYKHKIQPGRLSSMGSLKIAIEPHFLMAVASQG
jgi:hypothetical protein